MKPVDTDGADNGRGEVPCPAYPYLLVDFPILNAARCALLATHWITTLEQFVSVCATSSGRSGMATLLALSEEELAAILAEAEQALGRQRYQALSCPTTGGPTGALFATPDSGKGDLATPETGGGEKGLSETDRGLLDQEDIVGRSDKGGKP